MKIIHTADLHLGSRLTSNLDTSKARILRNELLNNFTGIVDYAKQNDVSVIIIAGDLFDAKNTAEKYITYFIDTVKSAPDIDFLYLKGNHDEYTFTTEDIPNNLKTFGDIWKSYDYDNVKITGIELNKFNSSSFYDMLSLPDEAINIVVLHAQESTSDKEAETVRITKLARKNIDYLALGHIHSYRCGKIDDRGIYAYCGCPQGRGYDEAGQKGFVLLDVQNKKINHTFIPFAIRNLYDISVDVTDTVTIKEIENKVAMATKDIPNTAIVKIRLIGKYTTETQKDLGFLEQKFAPCFFNLRIVDQSTLDINPDLYINDVSLKGEFIRTVIAQTTLSEKEKNDIIMVGLKALKGEEIDL